ncbi:MAG: Gfo/Idh/MocA family oxidoreductase [Planctomycetes bacterium]|nr:Gfo/Idh/MocA family oxidoreductase [Planctomycetota bacterium]
MKELLLAVYEKFRMHHLKINRRRFMRDTTLGISGILGFPYIIPCSTFGNNDTVLPSNRITLGLIGTGNINTHHRETFLTEGDANIVAVCDPVESRRKAYRDRINQVYGSAVCTDYRDYRELLDCQNIDAVCIGTPDHWHAVLAVAAMKAGKDVYLEKPLTLTVAEGRCVVETARAFGRVLQTGFQRRSHGAFRHACELVRNGRIGRLTNVEVGIIGLNKGVKTDQNFPTTPVPSGFDYNLWLGPAPVSPFCPQRVSRGNEICYWYYISDYTTGFISGNGVHFVDIAQWGIGDENKPLDVHTLSADIPADGLVDDAVAWQSEVIYENGVRMSYSNEGNPHPDGIRFIGTDGWIHITGGGTLSASRMDVIKSVVGPNEIHLYDSLGHHRNFLDCIKTRQPAAASVEIGHHATTTCNLVEISARLGRKVKWNSGTERFTGDEIANRLISRSMRAPWRV